MRAFKRISILLVVFVLTSALVACGAKTEDEVEEAFETNYLTMGTGGVAGTWYPVGEALANAMSKSGTVNVTVQTSAASLENIRLASNGERELGLATSGLLALAQQGVEMFEGEDYPQLASLANMMFMQFQILVRADSGIESFAELAGKVVGTGAPGSGDELFVRGILQAVGVYDDLKPMQLSFSGQLQEFNDGRLDVICGLASAPTAVMLDAASLTNVKFLAIDGADKAKVLAVFPFLVDAVITPEHYSFLNEDVNTLGAYTTLFTTTNIPEDVIYEAMKSMFGELKTIQAAHPSMETFTSENAVIGLPIELHPGAKKYYEEVGVM